MSPWSCLFDRAFGDMLPHAKTDSHHSSPLLKSRTEYDSSHLVENMHTLHVFHTLGIVSTVSPEGAQRDSYVFDSSRSLWTRGEKPTCRESVYNLLRIDMYVCIMTFPFSVLYW